MASCPVCEEELFEVDPGIDQLDSPDDLEHSFIARNFKCSNEDCPLKGKQLDVFWDFTRIDVDADEIDLDEMRKKFEEGK